MYKIKAAKYSIPKIIHFVWAGGQKLLGSREYITLKSWLEELPKEGNVFLWIDSKTYDESDDKKILKDYQILFNDYKLSKKLSDKIIIKDIRKDLFVELDKFKEIDPSLKKIILYYIEKFHPNFGASSDLIRYAALHLYGGAYFDFDVAPPKSNEFKNSALFKEEHSTHQLFIEHLTQQIIANKKQKTTFSPKKSHIGNDAFISTKLNPFFLDLLKESIYRIKNSHKIYNLDTGGKKSPLDDAAKKLLAAHTEVSNMMNHTIYATGPRLVKDIFKSYNIISNDEDFTFSIKDKTITLNLLRNGKRDLCKPIENTNGWLFASPRKFNSDKLLFKNLELTLKREMELFNYCNLSNHLLYYDMNKTTLTKKNKQLITLKNQTEKNMCSVLLPTGNTLNIKSSIILITDENHKELSNLHKYLISKEHPIKSKEELLCLLLVNQMYVKRIKITVTKLQQDGYPEDKISNHNGNILLDFNKADKKKLDSVKAQLIHGLYFSKQLNLILDNKSLSKLHQYTWRLCKVNKVFEHYYYLSKFFSKCYPKEINLLDTSYLSGIDSYLSGIDNDKNQANNCLAM